MTSHLALKLSQIALAALLALTYGSAAYAQSATGTNSTATGVDSQATGYSSTATGVGSKATANYATATGADSTASSSNATATGAWSAASGIYSTAIGAESKASGTGATAAGYGSEATGVDSVALGVGSRALEDNVVSVWTGYTEAEEDDRRARGRFMSPSERRIVNVADGINASDAVTKGQLDSVDQRISQDTQGIAANTQGIAANSQGIAANTQGIANVAAMATMPALPAGAESGFTAGVGGYSGKNALAIGFQQRLNANTTLKLAVATGSTGKTTVGAGISYSWGGPSQPLPGQNQQVVALQDQLRVQATENAAQDARMAAQAAENAALKQRQEAQDARMAALMARLESLEARAR